MGRNDRLKHAKEALRRLRYPRLTRVSRMRCAAGSGA